ncbi:hypothetical protein QJS10_CPA08g01051 [Acorus calamus]|uniref:ribonuclease P n=1 Tax=Acorus calamus TaxID=4465 RepID=A0AAV9EB19_ACOCL|nr:hypothetical protein QJS10_CPA08g01051 [Acorus calamus]
MRSLFSSSLHHLRPSLLPLPSRPPPLHHLLLRFTTTTSSSSHRPVLSKAQRRRAERSSPSTLLRVALDQCSRRNDLSEALRLYDSARADSVPLSLHHYNVLLYLCSNGPKSSLNRGFDIFRQMGLDQIPPNEATFTNLARLAAAADDPNLAFDVVKRVPAPRLRSYGPALFGFCKRGDFDGAFEVDEHMLRSGVVAEEAELRLCWGVEESTAGVCEGWFRSEAAEGVGEEGWDVGKVREGVVRGGGGWHGIGWLGKGRWRVGRAEVDRDGLAFQREVQSDFTQFQEWLARHGPFEAVVDGANVGYFNQYSFSFFQLNSVVNGIREMSPSKKLPLIILHNSRMRGGPADNPKVQKLLERWRRSGVLYTTPIGSNDDW